MLEVGSVAGSSIEILDTQKRFGGPQTLRQVILEDVGLVKDVSSRKMS